MKLRVPIFLLRNPATGIFWRQGWRFKRFRALGPMLRVSLPGGRQIDCHVYFLPSPLKNFGAKNIRKSLKKIHRHLRGAPIDYYLPLIYHAVFATYILGGRGLAISFHSLFKNLSNKSQQDAYGLQKYYQKQRIYQPSAKFLQDKVKKNVLGNGCHSNQSREDLASYVLFHSDGNAIGFYQVGI